MPTWTWVIVLVFVCVVFVVWRLTQLTGQSRKYFRAGYADPTRSQLPPEERSARAPETVREPTEPTMMETTVDEEAAELIQGQWHDTPPITSNVDGGASRAMDAALGEPETTREADESPAPDHGGERVIDRRRAAEEHHRAAEEHRRAADALDSGDTQPADLPADGSQQSRRGESRSS